MVFFPRHLTSNHVGTRLGFQLCFKTLAAFTVIIIWKLDWPHYNVTLISRMYGQAVYEQKADSLGAAK